MKKLLSILLLFISYGAFAQTYDQLPAGSKPYGNQLYLSSAGLIIGGTQTAKFRVIGTKKYVDSLLALKAPISPSGSYIQASPSTSQDASIKLKQSDDRYLGISGTNISTRNNDGSYSGSSISFGNNNLILSSEANIHVGGAGIIDRISDGKKVLWEGEAPAPGNYIKETNGSGTSTTLNSPTILNGSINNAPIGLSFPEQGRFTTLNANASTTLERLANKGQVNGYASLDASGKVPLTQVNDVLLGAVNYQGNYNAANNTPALPTANGNKGKYFVVTNEGTQQGLNFNSGDWIISNGTIWEKVDNNNKVASVNGRIGAVSGLAEQSSLETGQTIGANTSGNAATATTWGGREANFISFGTGALNYLTGQDFASGKILPWQAPKVQEFLGINTGIELVNSITGTAKKWGGLDADFANGYATDSAPAWLVGVEGSTGKARPFGTGSIANMLGIPAGGETLQSVTNRNSETNKMILVTDNGFWTRGAAIDASTIISGNNIQSVNYVNNGYKDLGINVGGGNVGIGTQTPAYKLDVNGDISVSNNLFFRGIGNTGLTFVNAGNTNAIVSNNYGLDFYTGNNSYNKALTIDVNGTAAFTGLVGATRFSAGGTAEMVSLYHDAAYIGFYNTNGDTRTGYIQSNGSGNMTLQSEAGSRTMQLNYGGGNIVLGNTTDDLTNKLQVSGSIRSTDLAGTDERLVSTDANGKIKPYTNSTLIIGNASMGTLNVPGMAAARFGYKGLNNGFIQGSSGTMTLRGGTVNIDNLANSTAGTSVVVVDSVGTLVRGGNLNGKANIAGGNTFTGAQIIEDASPLKVVSTADAWANEMWPTYSRILASGFQHIITNTGESYGMENNTTNKLTIAAPTSITGNNTLTYPNGKSGTIALAEDLATKLSLTGGSVTGQVVFSGGGINNFGPTVINGSFNATSAVNFTVPTYVRTSNNNGVASTAFVKSHVYSDTYTPTITGVSGATLTTALKAHYTVIGDIVTVTGLVVMSATNPTGAFIYSVSLPVASNLFEVDDLSGSANGILIAGSIATADIDNNVASIQVNRNGAGNDTTMSYTFTYKLR